MPHQGRGRHLRRVVRALDPIIPASNARMQAYLIPDARLYIYRGGHLSILTEADEHVSTVERFLCGNRETDSTA